MALPITGTTELMAKRRERSPSASAREATAVFTDSTVTNAPAQKEISEIKPLRTTRSAPSIFSELRTPEHRLSAKKQLIRGSTLLYCGAFILSTYQPQQQRVGGHPGQAAAGHS